jgi:hypothetical protein
LRGSFCMSLRQSRVVGAGCCNFVVKKKQAIFGEKLPDFGLLLSGR